MRLTHRWLLATPLAALLLTAAPTAARADEAEDRALLLIERVGGSVVRGPEVAGLPVVAVKLTGVKIDADLMKSLTAFPQLKGLDLAGCPGLNSRYLKQLASLPQLESLNLSHNPGVHGHFVAKLASLKHLRHLDISYCEDIDECGLEAIARNFKEIQHLDISGCREVTDEALRELRNNKELQVLHLANCLITDAGLKEVATFKELRTVNLANCPNITNSGVKELAVLEQLETLSVAGCDKLNYAAFRDAPGFKEVRNLDVSRTKIFPGACRSMTRLQTLNISGIRMSGHGLKQLTVFKELQTLIVTDNANLRDYGLEYLVHSVPQLQVLDVSGCEQLTDNGVKELAALKQLQILNLRRCAQVSDAGANALTAALPKIKLDR